MSLNRYAKKRDISEPEIVSALTKCGFTVERLDTPCDLLCGFRGRTFLVECKSGKKKLNDNQERFISGWRGSDVVVLRNAQEAIDWAVQVAVETERAA
jgi:hypothetical protein